MKTLWVGGVANDEELVAGEGAALGVGVGERCAVEPQANASDPEFPSLSGGMSALVGLGLPRS